MEIGNRVKIIDGSYAVRVDSYEPHTSIGLCRDIFEVIAKKDGHHNVDVVIHDIFIQNTVTGKIYLHSKALVKSVDPVIKELTLSDIEKRFGCRVKIIK